MDEQVGRILDLDEEVATEAIRRSAAVKAGDAGCEMYDLFQSVDDPNRFVLVESWGSQEALDAHGSSEAMKEMGKLGPHMDGRPTLYRYED